jgi:hypothetical protein
MSTYRVPLDEYPNGAINGRQSGPDRRVSFSNETPSIYRYNKTTPPLGKLESPKKHSSQSTGCTSGCTTGFDSLSICLPDKVRCSVLGNPFFWIFIILTVMVILISTANISTLLNDDKWNKPEWTENMNIQAIQWIWIMLIILTFLLPTIYVMTHFRHPIYKEGEDPYLTFSRCLGIGYVIVLILILTQSYTYLYLMGGLSTLLSILIIITLLWMIWLVTKIGRGTILASIGYGIFISWFIFITYIFIMYMTNVITP